MGLTSSSEILTNNHVIDGASSITATDVGTGTTYTARVVGYDVSHDTAVLALKHATALATVSLGNSATVRVGATTDVIGNAGGVGGTPSAAALKVLAPNQSIVAGDQVDRSVEQLSGLTEISQGLHAGDSGRPLINSAGRVIGIDTAATASFQFTSATSTAYAIPINQATTIAKQLIAGHATASIHQGATAFIGVEISRADTQGAGALIAAIIPSTPTAAASLVPGDLITGLDGHVVTSPTALSDAMLAHHPRDRVSLTWEDYTGTTHTTLIRLATGPAD
jgi:S1-C subfamily serine protease